MLDEIPKLFGRGFILGFLLPAAMFIAYIVYVAGYNPFSAGPMARLSAEVAGRIAVSIVVVGLALLLLNRSMVRFIEGYGKFNPLRLLSRRSKTRFGKQVAGVLDMLTDLEAAWSRGERPPVPDAFPDDLARAARSFPHEEQWVLPTRFGNTYRAFEAYPLVIYGMDAVVLWPRLMCVVPDTAQDQLRDARAMLDFHVNLFWLSIAAAGITLAVQCQWPNVLLAAPAVATAVGGWIILPMAVRRWGQALASIFDLYRQPLASSLGLEIPHDTKAERAMWTEVTKMMLCRSVYSADRLEAYRAEAKTVDPSYEQLLGNLYYRRSAK